MNKDNENKKYKTIEFGSKDVLVITADLYLLKKAKGFIVLCHRSHFNRGEYRETALKLNDLGFSCLAIDQRSGMNVLGVTNETSTLAKQKGLATGYLDARQDIEAAVEYSYKLNNNDPIIIFGSSYSASLALLISSDNKMVRSVIAFSPIEHLKKIDLAAEIRSLNKPTFVASAKKEIENTEELFRLVNKKYITQFKPEEEGFHGSKSLWKSVKGHEAYWAALEEFLINEIKKK